MSESLSCLTSAASTWAPIWLLLCCSPITWVISLVFRVCVLLTYDIWRGEAVQYSYRVHVGSFFFSSVFLTDMFLLPDWGSSVGGPFRGHAYSLQKKNCGLKKCRPVINLLAFAEGASIYINLQPLWTYCHIYTTALFSSEVDPIAFRHLGFQWNLI